MNIFISLETKLKKVKESKDLYLNSRDSNTTNFPGSNPFVIIAFKALKTSLQI